MEENLVEEMNRSLHAKRREEIKGSIERSVDDVFSSLKEPVSLYTWNHFLELCGGNIPESGWVLPGDSGSLVCNCKSEPNL